MDILQTLPTDAFVTAAFAELLADVTNLLASAQAQKPSDKAEITFWRRQQTALSKAQYHYLNGVRPTLTGDAYLMPSATSNGLNVYRLTRLGGILVCDCKAGEKGTLCWHHQLLCVIERAAELETLAASAVDDSGPDDEAAAQQLLASRLVATAQIVDAMRAAQGRTAPHSNPPVDIPDEDPPITEGDPEDPGEWRARPWYARVGSVRSAYAVL